MLSALLNETPPSFLNCVYKLGILVGVGGGGNGRKEGHFLFNDTLNTFNLRLYGVRHMVKDHSNSKRGNPLPPHRLLFLINSKGSFICTIPDRIAHTMAFVTPVVEHWLERGGNGGRTIYVPISTEGSGIILVNY